ncbi:MAG TPA: radical SAM protein [bacterium]|nr:radical SAM protein [bacterium]
MKKIKSLNLMVTSRCNGACNMCNIWKGKEDSNLNLDSLKRFLSSPEFSELEDLSISGGEPMLKDDIYEFSKYLIKNLPKLKMFFINTNGLLPEKTIKLARFLKRDAKLLNKDLKIYFSISIEGPKDIHETIRGRSYDLSIKTILLLKKIMSKKFEVIISMTLQKYNYKFVEQVSSLAKSLNCGFSFRFVDFSDNYYNNIDNNSISLSKKEATSILEKFKKSFEGDRFFQVLYKSVCSGKNDIMLNADGKLVCKAGSLFIFVKSDGNIYPCIYSKQKIGHISEGLHAFKLKRLKNCPCCTECHIYPMLNFCKDK